MQLLWTSALQRANGLLNRLSAAVASAELIDEALSTTVVDRAVRISLQSLRAELSEGARDARALSEALAAELPRAGKADLGDAVRDTLAPLRQHLARRELEIVVAELPRGLHVGVEPELLRAAIAASVGVLVGIALPAEVLRVTYSRNAKMHTLSLRLEARSEPPSLAGLHHDLSALQAWLGVRHGSLELVRETKHLLLHLSLPSAAEEPC
jgi:hypothetical protein